MRRLLLALSCAWVSACATYPQRTARAFADFERGDLAAAQAAYAEPKTTGSPFLRGAEAGTVALTEGDWPGAQRHFEQATAAVQSYEDRALVSAEDAANSLLSWAVNDSALDYKGEGFERVLLHACLGLAYLGQGQLEDVGVESRRANKLLESEETLYEKEYKAGGLGHFLSAVVYELQDDPSNAYIDYHRMHDKGIGTDIAGRALVRLSRQLGYSDDHEQWTSIYGADSDRPDDAASIVVIAGVGIGPLKEEHTLTIPTGDGILQASVPSFISRPQPVEAVVLRVTGGDQAVRTGVIEDVARVSSENLEDRLAWMAAKSVLRGIAKRELAQSLEKDHGDIGFIIGNLYTFVSERADLRAWQTLPDSWQAARAFVAPGSHELSLEAVGGERIVLGTFELAPRETMFVLARTVGNRLYAYPIGGKRPSAPPASPVTGPSSAPSASSTPEPHAKENQP